MKITKLVALVVGALFLSSCSSNQSSDSSNLVCALVEGYSNSKSLALSSAAQGGSAFSDIESLIGGVSTQVSQETVARQVFEDFLSAMSDWGTEVDSAHANGDSAGITRAASQLESRIDTIEAKCTNLGWKFAKGWR